MIIKMNLVLKVSVIQRVHTFTCLAVKHQTAKQYFKIPKKIIWGKGGVLESPISMNNHASMTLLRSNYWVHNSEKKILYAPPFEKQIQAYYAQIHVIYKLSIWIYLYLGLVLSLSYMYVIVRKAQNNHYVKMGVVKSI